MKLKGEYRPLAFPFSMIYLEKCEVRGAYTMAKSENQKVKTLFVAKYFLENSDENHPITAGDIVDYLREECGIEVERRAIYRDIAALRDVFKMDIDGVRGGKYRLLSRQFEFEDLRLLAECVHAAKFISASNKCMALECRKEWHPKFSGIKSGDFFRAISAYFFTIFRTATRESFSPWKLQKIGTQCLSSFINPSSYIYFLRLDACCFDKGTIRALLPFPHNLTVAVSLNSILGGVRSINS